MRRVASGLHLIFKDKYQLWSQLIRGSHQRFFIPTDQAWRLASRVAVDLSLESLPVPLAVQGVVIGLRPRSARYAAGVYLSFAPAEIEKVRRLIGLEQEPNPLSQTRRDARIDVKLPVRLRLPGGPQECSGEDVSASGIRISTPTTFFESERLDVALVIEGAEVPFLAEVVWANEQVGQAGLHFVNPAPESLRALTAFIEKRSVQEKKAEAELNALVVVADDDPAILQFLTTALTKQGYTVQQAQRGDEALALMRKVKPRLALLDVLMPGMDGVDVCKLMRADIRLVDVPVIFFSALDEEALDRAAADAGATDYLRKPVDLAVLLNVVGSYLQA